MGVAAIPLTIASGAISAFGKIQEGSAQAAASRYQAQVAANNAIIAQRNSDASLFSGQAAESAQRMRTTGLIGEQTVTQAASGIDVGTGSALATREQTQSLGDLDALTIRYNAAREAYGYKTQAAGYQAESAADRAAAKSQMMGGILGGVGSLIGTAASVTGQKAALKLVGAG